MHSVRNLGILFDKGFNTLTLKVKGPVWQIQVNKNSAEGDVAPAGVCQYKWPVKIRVKNDKVIISFGLEFTAQLIQLMSCRTS